MLQWGEGGGGFGELKVSLNIRKKKKQFDFSLVTSLLLALDSELMQSSLLQSQLLVAPFKTKGQNYTLSDARFSQTCSGRVIKAFSPAPVELSGGNRAGPQGQ